MVRVRFAPSPTGPLHIGSVRTALFNYLFARQERGAFLVRIEDTDQERSQKKYEQEILDSLQWLGLGWDEEVKRQSEHLEFYQQVAEELIQRGYACWSEDQDPDASGVSRCRAGKAVKLKIAKRRIGYRDLIHGMIEFEGDELGDFVIQKSNGFPTYHLACVVDDHEMGITHVIRGDDHISNTPRQLVIYEAMGWKPPTFAHLPLVFGKDRTPLSKRHASVSLSEYEEAGYLPEALLNYLALLGWSPGGNREFLTREELLRTFRLEDVHKTNACFDAEKLKWLNGEHIRHLPSDRYEAAVKRFMGRMALENPEKTMAVAFLYKERVRTFGELKEQCAFFFAKQVEVDPAAVRKYLSSDRTRTHLERWKNVLQQEGNFEDPKALEALLRKTAQEMKIDARDLIHPTRVAVSGRAVTPSLFEVMAILGKQKVIERMAYVTMNYSKFGSMGQKHE